jgi:galactose oxidase
VPNLGNVWHLPQIADPRGTGGMRDPIGAVVAGAELVIRSGNQFTGPGNAADQLQDGSAVLARRTADAGWTEFPMFFSEQLGNNKYYEARIPGDFLTGGDTVAYVLRIPYADRDTTFVHAGSAVTGDLAQAQAAPFTMEIASPADVGRWGPVLNLPNVAVHAVLLPTGRVLMWGRRLQPGVGDLHVEGCRPFRWDPATGAVLPSAAPDGPFNLFCSGHAFQPDGTLLVTGGHHLADGQGLATAFVYHPDDDRWERVADMNHGRWYPTATCLPDGGVLVTSGSYADGGNIVNNTDPQVWRDGAWHPVSGLPGQQAFELYPRQHVVPGGAVAMVGPQATTWYLGSDGQWTAHGARAATRRDYAPSAQYRDDRVLFLGGGNDQPDPTPTAACELLTLAEPPQDWHPAAPMAVPRRQHNATVLADGTVLVTGGTRGAAFNDLGQGAPVHEAELWEPSDAGGTWRTLAAELRDRCYHSTALLLPDGRVLSAGGGEFQVAPPNQANDPRDTHADAQVFSPPYLFAGPRPTIVSAPAEIDLGGRFTVEVGPDVPAARVTLLRLGAVTHAQAMDQRFAELVCTAAGTSLSVTAPASADRCPPGPYLLFVLSAQGVPSVAAIVRVRAGAGAPVLRTAAPERALAARHVNGTPVTVGIDGVCPYGIGACWGGANEALHALRGVVAVDPVPDQVASTATVHLAGHGLPPLAAWHDEFHRIVNGSYHLRGFEVELSGVLAGAAAGPQLQAEADRPAVGLAPLVAPVQNRPADPAECAAYGRLAELSPGTRVRVIGPLAQAGDRFVLQVRVVRS